MTTNNAINTGLIASSTEVKAGTSTRTLVVPSALNSYMSDMGMTGFISWAAAISRNSHSRSSGSGP